MMVKRMGIKSKLTRMFERLAKEWMLMTVFVMFGIEGVLSYLLLKKLIEEEIHKEQEKFLNSESEVIP